MFHGGYRTAIQTRPAIWTPPSQLLGTFFAKVASSEILNKYNLWSVRMTAKYSPNCHNDTQWPDYCNSLTIMNTNKTIASMLLWQVHQTVVKGILVSRSTMFRRMVEMWSMIKRTGLRVVLLSDVDYCSSKYIQWAEGHQLDKALR